MQVKEKFNHWLPVLLKTDGVTLGNHIYYKSPNPPHQLKKHELKHVDQYSERGIAIFLFLYLVEYCIGRLRGLDHQQAYLNISFEVEARKAEHE